MALPGVEQVAVKFDANVRGDARIAGLLQIPIKNIVAVASGKGGVGKSTVAVNLAVALAQQGARTGILDADVYGPNIPTMMGLTAGHLPDPENGKMVPPLAYGVEVMSMGFLIPKGQAVIWRGPMLHGAIRQLFTDVAWGALDYLIVDMPPGTGDVTLTLAQSVPVTGGDDRVDAARGGVGGCGERAGRIPEARSADPGHCREHGRRYLRHGRRRARSQRLHVPFLGRIFLDKAIREGGDAGQPIVAVDPFTRKPRPFSSWRSPWRARERDEFPGCAGAQDHLRFVLWLKQRIPLWCHTQMVHALDRLIEEQAWKDENLPELKTIKDINRYVRRLRDSRCLATDPVRRTLSRMVVYPNSPFGVGLRKNQVYFGLTLLILRAIIFKKDILDGQLAYVYPARLRVRL